MTLKNISKKGSIIAYFAMVFAVMAVSTIAPVYADGGSGYHNPGPTSINLDFSLVVGTILYGVGVLFSSVGRYIRTSIAH